MKIKASTTISYAKAAPMGKKVKANQDKAFIQRFPGVHRMSLLLGPILQFRGISGGEFHVSVLVALALDGNPASLSPQATPAGMVRIVAPKLIAKVPLLNPNCQLYRIDFHVAQGRSSAKICYTIDGGIHEFNVPGVNENFPIAYGSRFGFSDPSYMEKVDDNNERWQHLFNQHEVKPYNLFLMGGTKSIAMKCDTTSRR